MSIETQTLSADDVLEFSEYLRNCTDKQLEGVLEKELDAGRVVYAALAKQALERRQAGIAG